MSSKPELNEKLLSCVLKYIKNNPERYNQNEWCIIHGRAQDEEPYCGTIGCVAGWTCLLTIPEGKDWKSWYYDAMGDIPERAQEKLGLTDGEAYYLFGGTSSKGANSQYREILKRVAAIKKGRKKGIDPTSIHRKR